MKQVSYSNLKKIFPTFIDNYNSKLESKIDQYLNSLTYQHNENHFNYFKELVKTKFPKLLKTKTIIIGGTNGKGEVSYALSYLLHSHYNVATWSSPHLLSIRERICLNGRFIEYSELFQLFIKNKEISSSLNYYEFLFYNFLDYFNDKDLDLDFLILEVGVGGRLDAVNTLNPLISILTNISRDHQALLGSSYKKIVNEKMLIARVDNFLITCIELKYINQIINHFKKNVYNLFEHKIINKQDDYGVKNKLLALTAFEKIMPDDTSTISSIRENLKVFDQISFWGRRNEFIIGNKKITIMGAHNLDGARSTINYIKDHNLLYDKCLFGFSKKSEDELKKISYSLLKLNCNINRFIYCEFKCFKSLTSLEIDLFLPSQCERVKNFKDELILDNFSVIDNVDNNENTKVKNDNRKIENILISGSYYFIGDVLSFIFSDK